MSEQSDSHYWGEFLTSRTSGFFLAILILWITLGFAFPFWLPLLKPWLVVNEEMQVAGQFGDMFGMVNSLFSGLAFLAAMIAVLMQTIEMRESGERQSEQERLQLKQMEIAEETVRLQKQMRDEQRHDAIAKCFLKLDFDQTGYTHAVLSGKRRLEQTKKLLLDNDLFSVGLLVGTDGQQITDSIISLIKTCNLFDNTEETGNAVIQSSIQVRRNLEAYWIRSNAKGSA